jgi:hypothetical protein
MRDTSGRLHLLTRSKQKGGKRSGAGRPRNANPKKVVMLRLDPDTIESFKLACRAAGLPISATIETLISGFLRKRLFRRSL